MPPVALEQRIRKFECGYSRILVVTYSRVNGSISPDIFGSAAAPGLKTSKITFVRPIRWTFGNHLKGVFGDRV